MRAAWLVLSAILLATACQATGAGWIPSALDPSEKATFGFVYEGTTQTFSGSYHDRGCALTFCDVTIKGTGILRTVPPPAGMNVKGGCLGGEPTYESRDPARPGVGLLTLVACDGGGAGETDLIAIIVTTGPYAGYQNSGAPSGNITVTQP
jgi:hypothetical protein